MQLPYRWQIMGLALLMQSVVIGFSVYCFTFFLEPWMETFDAQRSDLLIAYTGQSLMGIVLSPLCGILIDRYPARWLVVSGIACFCLSLVVAGRATSFVTIVLVFAFVISIATKLAGPLMATSLVAVAFRENRGRALGLCALGTSIGGFVMPMVITPLLASHDWRWVIERFALAMAITLIPIALLVLRPRAGPAPPTRAGPPTQSTGQLFRDPSVFLLAIAALVPNVLFVSVLQNVGPLASDLQLTPQQGGMIVSATALVQAGGKFAAGSLADRVRHDVLYLVLAGLVGSGLVLTALAGSFYPLAVAVLLLGTSVGGIFPLIGTVAVARFGSANFGRVMGVVMSVGGLTGLGPLLAGWMRDTTGSYQNAFLSLAPLIAVALLCFLLLLRRPPSGSAEAADSADATD